MVLFGREKDANTRRKRSFPVFVFFACYVLSIQLIAQGCTVEFGPGDPICGNGTAEGDEVCDGEDLRGETCESLGLVGGTLACRKDCSGYVASGCTNQPECGNNIKEPGEACDGTDLGSETCESLGLDRGTLACNENCTFDTTGCRRESFCGNNIKEPGEACDGTDLGGETCETQGFYKGELACLSDCTGFDTSGCDPCPDGWVYIPAGEFEMGCNQGEPCWENQHNETPRHTVMLSAYCIQRTEVSVTQYRECKTAGGCPLAMPTEGGGAWFFNWTSNPEDREEHPMNGINWHEAREYCQWKGGDLPTEAQWEKAARGTDQRTYPWGNDDPTCDRCNWNHSGSGTPLGCNDAEEGPGTWPVGYIATTTGDSPYGLKDMAGNVYEWTLDCFDEDFYHDCGDNCENPANLVDDCDEGFRSIRGGSFRTAARYALRVVFRSGSDQTLRGNGLGFRCVKPSAQ